MCLTLPAMWMPPFGGCRILSFWAVRMSCHPPFTRHSADRNLGPGELARIEVPWPDGTVPTGGGFNTATDGGVVVQSSFPDPRGWVVSVRNTTNLYKGVVATAICSVP